MSSEAIAHADGTQDQERELDVEYVALVVLSTVARMQGKRGLYAVVDVMRGSKHKSLVEAGFVELPVHGLLKSISAPRLRAMVEVLLERGMVTRGPRKVLGITSMGRKVMTGDEPLPDDVAKAMRKAHDQASDGLFREDSPTLRKTMEMADSGLSPDEIADRRGMARSTIYNHLFVLVARGARFDFSEYVDDDFLAELDESELQWEPGEPISPIYQTFDGSVDWPELKLHLLQKYLATV